MKSVRTKLRGSLLLPFGLLGLGVAACDPGEPDAPEATDSFKAFENVTVIDTEAGELIEDQTVLVRDGYIDSKGPAGEIDLPNEAERIDGEGRYLMPGMAEMHGHLPQEGPEAREVEDLLFLYVANGVTLVRGMQGHDQQLEVREAIEDGELLGPRLVLGSPAMGWGNVPEVEEIPETVREFREKGYDLIKTGEGIRPEQFDALVEAGAEEGLPLAGHVPDEVGLLAALEAGVVTIDHLDNYVEEMVPEDEREDIAPLWGVASVAEYAEVDRLEALIEATLDSGVAQVPTMVLWETFFGEKSPEDIREATPEVRYMPEGTASQWEEGLAQLRETIGHPEGAARVVALRREIFQALHEADAEFLMGTDSPQLFSVPGFQNHREMALWHELGMSPAEVIRTATWNVARHFDEQNVAGSVAENHRADLILFEANPLQDLAAIQEERAGVMRAGEWLPEEEIQNRLEEIADR